MLYDVAVAVGAAQVTTVGIGLNPTNADIVVI